MSDSLNYEFKGGAVNLCPLRFCDWEEVTTWMRSRSIKSSMMAGIPFSVAHDQAMESVRIEQVLASGTDGSILATWGGMLQVVLVSVQRGNPEITIDSLTEMVDSDTKKLREAYSAVMKISFGNLIKEIPDEAEVDEDSKNEPSSPLD